MSHYRKIDVRIWNDAKFMALSDDAKMTFLLILTHPSQTMLGAMRMGCASLAEDLGWDIERLSKAFREALDKGLVRYDERARLMWLPNFLKYNKPESPNVVKAWPTAMDLLPECELKPAIWLASKAFVQGMSEGFRKAFESLREDYGESGAGAGAGAGAGINTPPFESERESLPMGTAQAEVGSNNRLPAKPSVLVRDADVERIYQAYPRKIAKPDALKAIRKAVSLLVSGVHAMEPSEALEFLYAKTLNFAHSPTGRAGKYTPHPATWFNQARYLDDEAEWQHGGDQKRLESRPATQSKAWATVGMQRTDVQGAGRA